MKIKLSTDKIHRIINNVMNRYYGIDSDKSKILMKRDINRIFKLKIILENI